MTAVPFDWSPIATPRAGEPRAVVGDEGDVGDAADANDARLAAAFSDSVADRLQHVAVVEVARSCAGSSSAKAGPTATTTSAASSPCAAVVALGHDRLGVARLAEELGGRDDLRQGLEERPALALEPVAGARPGVLVRIVDGRVHEAVRVDDRRRLQVVGGDALALHAEHRLGDVGEAAAVERERDVETGDAAREQLVRRLDVGRAVAIGHLARVVARGRDRHLLVRDRRQPEVGEHGLHGARRALAHAQELLLGDRLDAGVDLPVALDRQPLVEVVGVEVPAAERVVVPRHDRVARRDEVRPGEELAHELRRLADLRVRRDRVVAGRDLEVEPGGEHVLAEDRARPAGHREDERDARDRAVLHALRARRAHDGEAARLEVEHREALRVAHQRLRAGARGEAHLHAARRVGGAEERLRPWRVVAVDEDRLGAVDGEGLRVRDEAADRELEVPPLLDGALRHDAGTTRLRADEERDRVQRRVASHADGRLHLREAAPRRLGRVGREQRGALLEVRHVRLVPRCAPCTELLQREHELDRVEEADDAGELRRRETAREPDELGARDVHVDEHARELEVVERHRLGRDVEIEPVRDDEAVDDVELGRLAAVHAHDDAVLDDELRLGVVRPVRRDQPELGQRRDELLEVEVAGRTRGEATASHPRAGLAPRRRRRPRARRRRSPRRRALEPRRPLLELPRGRAAAAEEPCRPRAAGRRGRRRARRRARGSRRAASGPPRARPRPAGEASPASRASRRLRARRREPHRASRRRARCRRESTRGRDAASPNGVVTPGIEGHAPKL